MQRYRHYELTALLGDGKTGRTWQALDTGFEKPVTLKFLSRPLTESASQWLATVSDLANGYRTGLAPLFGIEQDESETVIVRGYIDGESVKAYSQRRMLSFDEFIALAIAMAETIKSCHSAGLVHGNLTADNFIVADGNRVWVTDAALWPDDAAENPAVTLDRDLAYAAPEMLSGEQPTISSDLYMLGVVYYELLTGRLPFTLDDRQYLVEAILHDEPNFENDATLRMAGDGRLIIQRLLAKSPQDRFSSADELLVNLEATKRFRRGEARVDTINSERWSARQYIFVAGVVALLILYWVIYGRFVK